MNRTSFVFETGATTHEGKVREVNEDNYLVRSGIGMWAVADGMGGHHAGRLASTAVINTLATVAEYESASGFLTECAHALEAANAHLREAARSMSLDMIGSTVVLLLVRGSSYACVWSGDSRMYRIRDGVIAQLTRDHSEVEDLITQGVLSREEARHWPRRNIITRAIGAGEQVELEIVNGEVEAGDVFLLCSDGLTGHLDDVEIASRMMGDDPQKMADSLVEATLERGASDNVTVVVVRCAPREPTVTDVAGSPNWTAG
ncbi:protein phosphatase 2C domain-containing protein [Ancylobacter sp. 6x-1]|uniref:Protein phosphatase 2C domain-containing protein n=1 Tax=Ancylobacter crimeensis TaxID=2579147 RepID=A0ABT0D7L2_9HYPH|nr:protein phosphatase 2C domain-containing protein [Ancylobacter crimeensis]MCK0195938.1 protein phosphatase 2C domain-containing protein [Ancylobacter crimeensis]